MFETAFVIHAKKDMPRAEALAHWHSVHADLVSKIPGVRRYLQGATFLGRGEPPYLGIAVLAFDDEESFSRATQGPEFAAAVADLERFADATALPTYVLQEPSRTSDHD